MSRDADLAAAVRHHQAGALDQAEAGYRAILARDPDDPDAGHLLGLIHLARGETDAAVGRIGRAVTARPDSASMAFDLGDALSRANRFAEARPVLRRSVELDPTRAEAWHLLGRAEAILGDPGAARACLRACLSRAPLHLGALRDLAASGATDVIAPLRLVLSRPDLSDRERMHTHFALAMALDRADDPDAAFAAATEANRLLRDSLIRSGEGFDAAALRGYVDARIAAFPPGCFDASQGVPDEAPVFIVGMPRSGTTLAEQVLASHPSVAGIGESETLAASAAALATSDPASVARRHLSWLRLMAGSAARIVDKTPDNLFHLGAAARLFPRARVIVCRRDPRDVCLSCHFQGFALPMPYATDLADCAERVRQSDRMLAHWRDVLPLRMLDLRYEAMVREPEATARSMVAFLDLPWDPACLAFHTRPGVVTSASVWQVRRPIQSGSAGRWRRYRRHLGPLLAAFGQGPVARGDGGRGKP